MTKLVLIALLSATGGLTPAAPDPAHHYSRRADVWSPRCATPVGVCYIAPQPVGSPCKCGEVGGTIVP
jgi:hypothetical protein